MAMNRIHTTLPREGGDLELRIKTHQVNGLDVEAEVEFLNRDLKWVPVPDGWARQILKELKQDFPVTFAEILAVGIGQKQAA